MYNEDFGVQSPARFRCDPNGRKLCCSNETLDRMVRRQLKDVSTKSESKCNPFPSETGQTVY